MKGTSLTEKYGHLFGTLAKLARAENKITESNVYQEANKDILKILDSMVEDNILPGSRLEGVEHLKDFLNRVKEGKRGLILMEHYSNFDLPGFFYMLSHSAVPEVREIADRLVAIAGMKLNEANPMVSAWAEGYSRIIIYPSRSLASITDPVEREAEEQRSRKINMASMRTLDNVRKEGKIILLFPAGTRYRPGKPETKRGVREVDSYLRLSDVMIPVSINGNLLRISEKDPSNMLADEIVRDKIIYAAGPVLECKSFRNAIQAKLDDSIEDKKQPVVDQIMHILEEQHDHYEKIRQQ